MSRVGPESRISPSVIFCWRCMALKFCREVIGEGKGPGYPDLIALRSGAFRQTVAQALSGWFVIGCGSAEYYCDAYASEPTVDQYPLKYSASTGAVISRGYVRDQSSLGPGAVKEPDAPTPAGAEYVRSAASAFPWPDTEIPAVNYYATCMPNL